jgi:hypothetical protein
MMRGFMIVRSFAVMLDDSIGSPPAASAPSARR